MPTTEHFKVTFVVKEGDRGAPFIAVEPTLKGVGSLVLSLRSGTTLESAQQIATYLNSTVPTVGLIK